MTKLAPEWVRTNDPVIRSPARYRWATAPANIPGYESRVMLKTNMYFFLLIIRILDDWFVSPYTVSLILKFI